MLYTIKQISIDKQKNFVFILIYNRIGNKEDGLSYGPDKILMPLAIENLENRNKKVKVVILDF